MQAKIFQFVNGLGQYAGLCVADAKVSSEKMSEIFHEFIEKNTGNKTFTEYCQIHYKSLMIQEVDSHEVIIP